ncbi:MAG: glycosyltransferase family 9 protein [Gammaproteobacteria bacterium]
MPPRVLIIRVGLLGDTVMATHVIEPLRRHFGGKLRVDWVAKKGGAAKLLSLDARIGKIYPIAHRRWHWLANPGQRALKYESARHPYDALINLEASDPCDGIARVAMAKEKYGRPFQIRPDDPRSHDVVQGREIVAPLVGDTLLRDSAPLFVPRQGVTEVRSELQGVNYALVNPSFSHINRSGYRAHRAWPVSHWRELIGQIKTELGLDIVINGAPGDHSVIEALLKLPGVHSIVGSPLSELIGVLRNATCVVSVDTGVAHLAAALGTPTITLFGPTDPGVTGPFQVSDSARAISSQWHCSPCVNTARQRQCQSNECMGRLFPERVFAELKQLVGNAV